MHITAQGLRAPVSEMIYTVSSGTLNSTIPYHLLCDQFAVFTQDRLEEHEKAQEWLSYRLHLLLVPKLTVLMC